MMEGEGESDEDVDVETLVKPLAKAGKPKWIPKPMPAEAVKWYAMKPVLFELTKCLQHRELAFLNVDNKCVRDLSGWKVEYLEMSMKAFDFTKWSYRIYQTLAWLEHTPMTSFNPEARREEHAEVSGAWATPDGYDLAMDFDGKGKNGVEKAKRDTIKMCEFLDGYNIPYYVKWSGSCGFHIVVDDKFLPYVEKEKWVWTAQVVKALISLVDVKTLDGSIYDRRRILKTAFSIDFKSGEPLVVLPLSDEQLRAFKMSDMKISSILHNHRIYQRGLLTRPGDANNVNKMLEDLGIQNG